jgi:putative hydrolase of the HAD superfamily
VRAIFFDAVGTLLFPQPPATSVYWEVSQRFGSGLSVATIRDRFAAAFAREEEIDRQRDWHTDEEREKRRWQDIVAAVLDDVSDPGSCFQTLYHHFALPGAWKVHEEAAGLLPKLADGGYVLGLASNLDCRLRSVVAGFPELRPMRHLAISSEIGWRKPSPRFFAAMTETCGCRADQVLYVGDDLVNDYDGARAAGLRALLFDPGNHAPATVARTTRLTDLLARDLLDTRDLHSPAS